MLDYLKRETDVLDQLENVGWGRLSSDQSESALRYWVKHYFRKGQLEKLDAERFTQLLRKSRALKDVEIFFASYGYCIEPEADAEKMAYLSQKTLVERGIIRASDAERYDMGSTVIPYDANIGLTVWKC